MVHNKNQILDCGQLKNIAEVIMPKQENYRARCYQKPNRVFRKSVWDEDSCDYVSVEETNPNPKPWFPKLKYWFNKDNVNSGESWWENSRDKSWLRFQDENLEAIHDYLDIIPFIPCMMFNISPNWKDKVSKDSRLLAIKKFRKVIELYLNNCDRYGKWKYCIESGSEDNFIHAHIVAEINPKVSNSGS